MQPDKIPLKDEQDLYAPLMDLAEKKAEEQANQILHKAENFLSTLKQNPKIYSVVENRVFIEVLEEGDGRAVASDDVVAIQFKEYGIDGVLLKDTSESLYNSSCPRRLKDLN